MKELQIYNNEIFGEIRTLEIEGKIYFVGRDVAKSLGYSNINDAISRHCKGVVKHDILTKGGKQQMNIIPEGDLYRLITNSELPTAEKFEEWVFDEVLPQIRETGSYNVKAHKPSRKKPKDISVKQHLNIANALVEVTGIKKEIAYAVAIGEAEKETGEDFTAYKKLLPSAEHETGFLNPTMVGQRIGKKAQEVNLLLQGLGLQYRDEKKDWRLTEEGKNFGEEFPYKRNNHTGYQIRWNENIVDEITCVVA